MDHFILRKPDGSERRIRFGEYYVKEPDEEIVPPERPQRPPVQGSPKPRTLPVKLTRGPEVDERHDQITQVIKDERIEAGNLVAAITTSTGFKKWWEKHHGGECSGCNRRQAAYNYIKFQGPRWLKRWIHRQLGDNVS